MVLLLIALLAALVLSFFAAVRVETVSSASYSERTKAQMFADSAKNLAIGQIQKGTEGVDGGKVLAWASQPGMIRTWDQRGSPVKAYKLYSSDEMIVDGGYKSQEDIAKDVPNDWKTRPEEFVDLNSPVLAEDTKGPITKDGGKYTARFPIISGNNLKPATAAAAKAGSKTYDPVKANIEGFWVEGQPDVSDGQIGPDNNPIPMPVRWLYMLQDGKIAAAGSTGSVQGASKTNPIVARVAFWTDDETTKVNINTASEGVFWDRPYNGSLSERNFGNNIPGQNEFASFPGHPATTSLSTVLGSILPVKDNIASVIDYNRELLPYYDLVPRVAGGGSRGGLYRAKGVADVVKYDADRLYSSVDEFIFKAKDRGLNNNVISNDFLNQARFFLTAHSRGPEVNMFNLPRISLWPLDPNVQNSKDKLISYCSTINGKPFYFSRTVVKGSAPSATEFLNTSQSSFIDWDKYPRNKVLYNYLQKLTDANIPGLGGSLAEKYSGNLRNQILTEMVDLLRSGVNTVSSELDPVYNYAPPRGVVGQGQVVPLRLSNSGAGGTDTQGFGRFMTISEASLILYHASPRGPSPGYYPTGNEIRAVFVLEPFCPSPGLPGWSPNVRIRVRGLDGFQINGMPLNLPRVATMTCNTFEVAYQAGQPNTSPASSTAFPATRLMFYYNAGSSTKLVKRFEFQEGEGDVPANIYPFVSSAPITLLPPTPPQVQPLVSLRGAKVEIEILGPNQSETAIQKLTVDFSDTRIPIQGRKQNDPVQIPAPEPLSTSILNFINLYRIDARIPAFNSGTNIKDTLIPYEGDITTVKDGKLLKQANVQPPNLNSYDRRGDVVRSMEAAITTPLFGDLRALSLVASTTDDKPLFSRHPFYDAFEFPTPLPNSFFDPTGRQRSAARELANFNYRLATGLRSDENVFSGQFASYILPSLPDRDHYTNGFARKGTFLSAGSLLKLANPFAWIQRDAEPSVPTGLDGAFIGGDATMPGDWDAGLGVTSDGPYINLPDQGNSSIRVVSGLQAEVGEIYGGYFGRGEFNVAASGASAAATFSPNRQIASAVAFGSLSTGVDPKKPGEMQAWRTLLFCANPAAGYRHPGFGTSLGGGNPYPPYYTPPDHAFLDFFTMPIVEGYPISEPLSTAGKINMNYQIAPFTYIHRSTAIRAVMKKVRISAVPGKELGNTDNDNAIKSAGTGSRYGWKTQSRFGINLDEKTGTLKQFEQRFEKGDLFRSASEICDMFLVPRKIDGTLTPPYVGANPPLFSSTAGEINFRSNPITSWWKGSVSTDYSLTADNLRETPYGHIYPRLTTKSNSYTVHVRVQTLAKSLNTPPAAFVDPKRSGATDSVTGEYRGSFEIERYLDPNALEASGLDLATVSPESPTTPLGQFYKYRTISAKEFRP